MAIIEALREIEERTSASTCSCVGFRVCHSFYSDMPLMKGESIDVEVPLDEAGLVLRSSLAEGNCPPWPREVYLVLIEAEQHSEGGRRSFRLVSPRWEKWVLPVNAESKSLVQAMTREQILAACRRYVFLCERYERTWQTVDPSQGLLLPIGDDDDEFPVVVVRYLLAGAGGQVRNGILVSIWGDGRVIWSNDQIRGEPPYREGHIPPERIRGFLRRVKGRGLLGNERSQELNPPLVVDGGRQILTIRSDVGSLELVSSHEIYPNDPVPDLKNEFLSAWEALRSDIRQLIPETGRVMPWFEYQVLPVPARVSGVTPKAPIKTHAE